MSDKMPKTIDANDNYEAARARWEKISSTFHDRMRKLRNETLALVNEYDNAAANLRRYESSPGIPLPEYRDIDTGRVSRHEPGAGINS